MPKDVSPDFLNMAKVIDSISDYILDDGPTEATQGDQEGGADIPKAD